MDEILAKINYFCREGLWHSIVNLCDVEMKKGLDPVLVFWKGFGIFKEGSPTEAIREVEMIQNRREISYAAISSLIYYHEHCRIVDREAVESLQFSQENAQNTASDRDLINTALFYLHINELKRASQTIMGVIDSNPSNLNAIALKGWIYLAAPKSDYVEKALQIFDSVLNEEEGGNVKHLDALLGRAAYYEKIKKYNVAIEIVTEVTIAYKEFTPANIIKAKLHIISAEWELVLETVQKVLYYEETNIEALRIYIFYLLSRERDDDTLMEKLEELTRGFDEHESRNAEAYYSYSKLFARICSRNSEVLKKSLEFIEKACALRPENCKFTSELAYQRCLVEDYNDGFLTYQKAATYDESNMEPLYGMIYCRIQQGKIEDALQQVELVNEISEEQPKTAQHFFIEGMISYRRQQPRDKTVKLLDQCLNLHITQTKEVPAGFEFYTQLNPEFLLELSKEYLKHAGVKPLQKSEEIPRYMSKAIKLLENIIRQYPINSEANIMLAKARWLTNEVNIALKILHDCLKSDPKLVEAHVLTSIINMESGDIQAANNALQQAFSQDFSIRENPVFLLIKAQVEKKMGNYQEALKSLETAYELPGVKDKNAKAKDLDSKKYNLAFGIEERAKIFILLIEVKAELADFAGAKKILQKSVVEFSSTTEEVHIIIAQSNLFMKMGDIKKALNMLKKVGPENPNFIEAKKKAAEIYLEQLRDRKNYKRCYMEIIDVEGSEANLRMVGDALMDIQEPEEAVIYYEKALQVSGDDISLVREIGKAHVMTHDYNKAIRYYETALQNDPKLLDLSTDLAELYFKLKAFDEAKRVIIEAMKSLNSMDDPDMTNSKRVQYTLLMARIFLEEDVQSGEWRFKPNEDASKALYDALAVQEAVFDRVREISIDRVDEERKVAANINYKLAKYLEEREGDYDGAIRALESCIKRDETHKQALFALAKLHLAQNDPDKCVYFCRQLLKQDPSNEETSFMMANLMMMRGDTEEALQTFKSLLAEKPDNFKALSQLVILFRKAGRIEEADKYITLAENNAIRSNEAGLAYAKGLYYRFTSEPQKALKALNRARFDSFYGEDALVLMILIYLNPHDEIIYSAKDKEAVFKTSPENMKAADVLVKELSMKEFDTTILECYAMVHTHKKEYITKAAKTLEDMIKGNSEYVPAILCLAVCKFMSKKASDAKTLLEKLTKINYLPEYSDEFETGWLLLADYYIANSKSKDAELLLDKCLQLNKSLVKAEELMGVIREKDGDFLAAADHYQAAWKMSSNRNASVGFRLAFNYLKTKKFVRCIDICKEVLKNYPEYETIKKDILIKAQKMIRSNK